MLTNDGCAARRRELLGRFPDHDLLLVSQPRHVFYLSGYLTRPTELAGWGPNFLLIDREGGSRLLADNWSEGAAGAAHVDEAEIWTWYDFSGPAEEKYAAAAAALGKSLREHYPKLGQVAVDAAHLPLAARQALEVEQVDDLGPTLLDMRRGKHDDELVCIRRALRATEVGHQAARDYIRPEISEIDIYVEVQGAITKAAGEPIVMLGDFAAGRRSEAGGGPPTDNLVKRGDLMIFDLFPVIGGYRGDITNTLCVGEPTQEQLDHVAALQQAMSAAEGMLRPGVSGRAVYEACQAPLVEAGLGEAFFHHAGHGLGLGHPERPYFVPNSADTLQAGDVVTLEPGAYLPGWGGARIEHNYLITEEGYERLSNHEIGL
jgi:Xaa-Pro aminopeptidase